ncbi:MAG: hypothetical protein SFU98_13105 [Leptospiraceae bacterium]|nr:hypothetical protein [Leptospiraceae bacterium]
MEKLIYIMMLSIIINIGCGQFKEQANTQFGDQHFKTAIALIELHKVRYNSYPESLSELKYLGKWDIIVFNSVKYTKLKNGYNLDLIKGWIGKPKKIEYPQDFWNGLGLKNSNLK